MDQRRTHWLLLVAYGCSGCAGLVYQVTWTRLLTLYMGHSTAAVSTVVAAFMGGLGLGAMAGGRVAGRLGPRQALMGYAALEGAVAVVAVALPQALNLLTPVLRWAYQDGLPGVAFPAVRLVCCLALLMVPALALGATFPLAARWLVARTSGSGMETGALYAANTSGAALGAALAGFVLLPALGMHRTTFVGVGAGILAAIAAILTARQEESPAPGAPAASGGTRRTKRDPVARRSAPVPGLITGDDTMLAGVVLALTGFATFTLEIAWARMLSQIFGPTTYAFAATVSLLICGMAFGSALGAWLVRRTVRLSLVLAIVLTVTAGVLAVAMHQLGVDLPRRVALQLSEVPLASGTLLGRHIARVAMLLMPVAFGLGLAFPVALAHIRGDAAAVTRRLGAVFGVNTLAAVAGALAAGFLLIPGLGLQRTLVTTAVLLTAAAAIALVRARPSRAVSALGAMAIVALGVGLWRSPGWDRELLASGVYKPGTTAPPGLDVETTRRAGRLLYFRDGAASTVAVKELTGALSLSIDGKVDASTSGDMLTQRALAHVPLLLHPNPKRALIVGLGSGVTLGSALLHPLDQVDVLEISPEVVEASAFFAGHNRRPLEDPRSRLVTGDGRLHLKLSSALYDVIVSEPSNPWMSGVAALFTREFFEAARSRLAPGGIICQWAHAYDISLEDLRSIVATFLGVFPQGTLWLIGESDILLVASDGPLDARLDGLSAAWSRPGVADDLRSVGVTSAFELLSLYGGGPGELARFSTGAAQQTDDGMRLEFSGPRSLSGARGADNTVALHALLVPESAPVAVRNAMASAGAAQWRNRAAMLFGTLSFEMAYQDYLRAVRLDPTDPAALEGLVHAAMVVGRGEDLAGTLDRLRADHPSNAELPLAASKLQLSLGRPEPSIALAEEAVAMAPDSAAPLEHLASMFATLGDASRLDEVVDRLRRVDPHSPHLSYYAANSLFLQGRLDAALPLAHWAAAEASAFAPAHNLLGAIHASMGNQDAARRSFEEALRLDAENSITYQNLGLLSLERADHETAERLFTEALLLDPDSPAAREGLARSQTP